MCYNNNNHSVDIILASSPKYANTKTVRNLLIKAYELGQEESQKGVIKRKGSFNPYFVGSVLRSLSQYIMNIVLLFKMLSIAPIERFLSIGS